MNSRDAIVKALTPGDMFNQKGHVWRSVRTLTQFASCEPAEVLDILDEHFQDMVTVKPNTNHPEHGPLVALNLHIPAEEPEEQVAPEPGQPQVQILGGNAVAAEQPAVQGVVGGVVPGDAPGAPAYGQGGPPAVGMAEAPEQENWGDEVEAVDGPDIDEHL